MRKLAIITAVALVGIALNTTTQAQTPNYINCATGNPNWSGQHLVDMAHQQQRI